jgi:outer membrane protein
LTQINIAVQQTFKLSSHSGFTPTTKKVTTTMKATWLALALIGAGILQPAMAQENSWMVRVRALHMKVDNGNSPQVPGAKVEINDKTFPEIDFTYHFTRNLAAELVLTYPQKHDVKLEGAKIGTIKHLPPALLVQYHFMPASNVNPYLGAGINYTRFMDASLPSGITHDKDSVGFALQAGVDVEIAKNVYLNLDYKRVNIETDIKVAGAKLTTLKVDPDLISVGIGWRF